MKRFSTMQLRHAMICLAAAALAFAVQTVAAQAQTPRPSLVIEAESGRVLHAENASAPWYPASLTKLMTVYVVFDAIRNGEITLDTPLTYSEVAAAAPPTKMGFDVGTVVTVDNALKMMIVRSSNDVTVMVAENLGGTVNGFIERMNATARRLGMNGSRFVNPHGLPVEGQVTTARDMAVLARALYREFPQHAHLFRIGAIQFGGKTLPSYNMLIGRYPGAEGMKTGYIRASGFNLVASASRNGRRLIAVVMGSESGRSRAEDAAALLEKGFKSWGLLSGRGTVSQLPSRLGTPPNIWPEIVALRKARGASANAGESDGLDGQGDAKSLLSARPESVVRVTVYTGPNPARPDVAAPATAAAIAVAAVPMPMPRPDHVVMPVKPETASVAPAATVAATPGAATPVNALAEGTDATIAPTALAPADTMPAHPALSGEVIEPPADITALIKEIIASAGGSKPAAPPPPGTDLPSDAKATTPGARDAATTPRDAPELRLRH